ncbi:MAG: hypothetical protein ACTSXW_04855 [Candidatus Baldrarchaeia archaeon]
METCSLGADSIALSLAKSIVIEISFPGDILAEINEDLSGRLIVLPMVSIYPFGMV